jgi:hypothetical protein
MIKNIQQNKQHTQNQKTIVHMIKPKHWSLQNTWVCSYIFNDIHIYKSPL